MNVTIAEKDLSVALYILKKQGCFSEDIGMRAEGHAVTLDWKDGADRAQAQYEALCAGGLTFRGWRSTESGQESLFVHVNGSPEAIEISARDQKPVAQLNWNGRVVFVDSAQGEQSEEYFHGLDRTRHYFDSRKRGAVL